MTLLVVGSVALDKVETPHGKVDEELGGSAVYFSFAASRFTPVRLVGVVGEDFHREYLDRIAACPVDLAGLKRLPGATFRWHGTYEGRMDRAETVDVQLNVFGGFRPEIPRAYADSDFVFLANGSPFTHMRVLEQLRRPKFVMADTMNFYIAQERDGLMQLLERVDALVLNDAEALQLSGRPTVLEAALWVCRRGPRWCIIKKGEHGALLRGPDGVFALPAFPHHAVVDPTGAGDSFAGGFMGHLARSGNTDAETMRTALAYGIVAASFAIEQFGPWVFERMTDEHVEERMAQYIRATHIQRPGRAM